MLWGASMAAGAEALRRTKNMSKATGLAIKATQIISDSFQRLAKATDCKEITKCNWSKKCSIAKYMVSGKIFGYFNLASKWVPQAIEAAHEGLKANLDNLPEKCISFAPEIVRKMEGTDEEVVMVAGFAGGLGLKGGGCGALVAAIWKTILELVRKRNWKYTLNDPVTMESLNRFLKVSDYKIECYDITGKKFSSAIEHSDFIINGGCDNLINTISQTAHI